MPSYSVEYTNFLPLFDDLGLNSKTDMLWLLHHNNERKTIDKLEKKTIWKDRKNIFLIDSENLILLEQSQLQKDSRIHVWTPCVLSANQFNLYHFWFDWMQEIEKSLHCVDRLQQNIPKNYFFDALLGTHRDHKHIVHNYIQNSPGKNKFLVSYSGNRATNPNSKWIPGVDDDIDNGKYVIYNKVQRANGSCVVPYLVYNQCWYSLVAETSGKQPNFYSEKTGKPLLGKRIFVMFAAQHHLKYLKESGFRTFNGIIDESYDDIADLETRYQQAWKQVEYLLQQDPIEIYKQAEPILEHNYNHFMSTNWQKEMHEKIQNISHSSK